MHIRPATPADLSSTASMSVDAFWNDELYDYTNRWREEYPDHFRDSFLRRHRLKYWSPGLVFHVVATDEGDEGHIPEGKVVGYSVWERRALERLLLQATDTYLSLIRADKSLDSERLAHFLNECGQDFSTISEMWKLQNLCVHVDYQGRGIGSMMIDWGKRQAQKEKCPIGLESSMAARPVYLKNGFRKYGNMEIKDFPIQDVPTFIWEPAGMEGRWGMEGDTRT